MKINLICTILLLFCALIQSNTCVCSVDNSHNQSVVRPVISATKYISIFLCVVYGFQGAKKAIHSARLLLPEGSDFKITDIVKYPFKLVFELPFKACDAIKDFIMAGGFGGYAFVVHKIGF